MGFILVVKAVCRHVQGIVSNPQKEEDDNKEIEILRYGQQQKQEAQNQKSRLNDPSDREPVVDPANRKGKNQRGKAIKRNDRTNLPAA